MKKLIFVLVFLLMAGNVYAKNITFDTFITADDVTLERLQSNFNTLVNNLLHQRMNQLLHPTNQHQWLK